MLEKFEYLEGVWYTLIKWQYIERKGVYGSSSKGRLPKGFK